MRRVLAWALAALVALVACPGIAWAATSADDVTIAIGDHTWKGFQTSLGSDVTLDIWGWATVTVPEGATAEWTYHQVPSSGLYSIDYIAEHNDPYGTDWQPVSNGGFDVPAGRNVLYVRVTLADGMVEYASTGAVVYDYDFPYFTYQWGGEAVPANGMTVFSEALFFIQDCVPVSVTVNGKAVDVVARRPYSYENGYEFSLPEGTTGETRIVITDSRGRACDITVNAADSSTSEALRGYDDDDYELYYLLTDGGKACVSGSRVYYYDKNGTLYESFDWPSGEKTTYGTDGGSDVVIEYDESGNVRTKTVTETSADGVTTISRYFANGTLCSQDVQNPDGSSTYTYYSYDGEGNALSRHVSTYVMDGDSETQTSYTAYAASSGTGDGWTIVCSAVPVDGVWTRTVYSNGKVVYTCYSEYSDDDILTTHLFNVDGSKLADIVFEPGEGDSPEKAQSGTYYEKGVAVSSMSKSYDWNGDTVVYTIKDAAGTTKVTSAWMYPWAWSNHETVADGVRVPVSNFVQTRTDGTKVSGIMADGKLTVTVTKSDGTSYSDSAQVDGLSSDGSLVHSYALPIGTFKFTIVYDEIVAVDFELADQTSAASTAPTMIVTTTVCDGTKPAEFHSSDSLENFKAVYVDDKLVDPSNYDVSEGSIKVVLHPAFLKTLGEGTHTISIESKNGVAKAEFTIPASNGSATDTKNTVADTTKKASDKSTKVVPSDASGSAIPDTFDASVTVEAMAGIAASGAALASLGLRKRR
jgi:hypothetical protein